MTILRPEQVAGDLVELRRTSPLHLTKDGQTAPLDTTGKKGFDQYLIEALENVSSMQNASEDLAVLAVTDPDSVNPEEITIAMAEATLALNITRTVFDRALQAYNNIINMR